MLNGGGALSLPECPVLLQSPYSLIAFASVWLCASRDDGDNLRSSLLSIEATCARLR